jgi:hypothetical protein
VIRPPRQIPRRQQTQQHLVDTRHPPPSRFSARGRDDSGLPDRAPIPSSPAHRARPVCPNLERLSLQDNISNEFRTGKPQVTSVVADREHEGPNRLTDLGDCVVVRGSDRVSPAEIAYIALAARIANAEVDVGDDIDVNASARRQRPLVMRPGGASRARRPPPESSQRFGYGSRDARAPRTVRRQP